MALQIGDDAASIVVKYVVLDVAKDRLNDLATEFQNIRPDVETRHDQVLAGAGEFSDHLQMGAAKFLISWSEAFNVCGESAGLMAANTHNFKMDFAAVDVDQQQALTI